MTVPNKYILLTNGTDEKGLIYHVAGVLLRHGVEKLILSQTFKLVVNDYDFISGN